MNVFIKYKMLIIVAATLVLISTLSVIIAQNNQLTIESNAIEKAKIDKEKKEMEAYRKAFTG